MWSRRLPRGGGSKMIAALEAALELKPYGRRKEGEYVLAYRVLAYENGEGAVMQLVSDRGLRLEVLSSMGMREEWKELIVLAEALATNRYSGSQTSSDVQLTTSEAAAALGVTAATLRSWMRRGVLPDPGMVSVGARALRHFGEDWLEDARIRLAAYKARPLREVGGELSLAEVAEHFRVDMSTIAGWINEDMLPLPVSEEANSVFDRRWVEQSTQLLRDEADRVGAASLEPKAEVEQTVPYPDLLPVLVLDIKGINVPFAFDTASEFSFADESWFIDNGLLSPPDSDSVYSMLEVRTASSSGVLVTRRTEFTARAGQREPLRIQLPLILVRDWERSLLAATNQVGIIGRDFLILNNVTVGITANRLVDVVPLAT